MPAYNSVPLVVAQAKGLFAQEGVQVTLVPFSSQLNRETALQTGAIDGTVSDMINAIQAWAQGFGGKVTSVTEGGFSLLASKQSGIRTLADWDRRQKVSTGLLQNSIVFYTAERMLSSSGHDPAKIDLVPIVQVPARLEMLAAGKIDAACLPEPLATLAVSQGASRLADTDAIGSTTGVLLFGAKALADKAPEIRAFYRAYDRAVAEVNADWTPYRDQIVQACEFPPPVAPILKVPRFRASFLPSPEQVQDVARWMIEKGLVTRAPGYTDVVAEGFVGASAP